MLTSGNVKDGRRIGEESWVLGEIGNSESSRHDDESKRLKDPGSVKRTARKYSELLTLTPFFPLFH